MVRRRLGAAVLLAGLGLALPAACGPSGNDVAVLRSDHCPVGGCVDAAADGDGGPVSIPDEPLEPWDTSGAGPLTGIFAVETTIHAKVVIPVETRQLFRLRIVQHGNTLKQRTTLCAFKLPDVENVATLVIPPKLQALMQKKYVDSEGEFLSGVNWTPPPSLLLVGAKLANPATDKLPTLKDPTNAIDEDEDGNPGVTLGAKVVTCKGFEDLYVALRTSVSLTGKITTADTIQGAADVHLDQSVVGMSDPCLQSAAQISIQIQPGSPFKAVRVGAAQDVDQNGNVSCPEIDLHAVDLFGDYWAN